MRLTFSHFLYGTACLCLVYSLPTFAAECALSDTSSSPIQSYKKNIDSLNTFLRQEASTSKCDTGTASGSSTMWNYISTIVPMDGAVSLMKEVSSLTSSGAEFYTEAGAFLDPAGPLNELKAHRDNIEEIERSILETTQYIWAHCAGWQKITKDMSQKTGGYIVRDRTLSQVVIEMARETSEVKRFFSILWQWVQTEEYIDEVPFPIASSGFSTNMYVYFSPKKLQECRNNTPRNQAFWEAIKKAFTSGWKYPQAIQVWKDAMALLLYRWSQIGWFGGTDVDKDAKMDRIVKAKMWWLGNSDIMINSQFFKEFWYRPDTKTLKETVKKVEKKLFYQKTWYDFIRRVIPNLITQEGWPEGQGYIRAIQTTEELDKVARQQDVEKSLYSQYHQRKADVEDRKARDAKTGSPLANTIWDTKQRQDWLSKLMKVLNGISGEQAKNVPGAVR